MPVDDNYKDNCNFISVHNKNEDYKENYNKNYISVCTNGMITRTITMLAATPRTIAVTISILACTPTDDNYKDNYINVYTKNENYKDNYSDNNISDHTNG